MIGEKVFISQMSMKVYYRIWTGMDDWVCKTNILKDELSHTLAII